MTTAPATTAADPDFESDLFNVCEDSGACMKGFFCPCLLVGEIHEKMGQSHWAFCCLSLIGNNLGLACARRGMIRHAFNLHYTPCGDCLAVTCCGPCAAIQEYNQVSKKTYPIRSDINEWGTGLFDCMDEPCVHDSLHSLANSNVLSAGTCAGRACVAPAWCQLMLSPKWAPRGSACACVPLAALRALLFGKRTIFPDLSTRTASRMPRPPALPLAPVACPRAVWKCGVFICSCLIFPRASGTVSATLAQLAKRRVS